jgi:hypothetical protein
MKARLHYFANDVLRVDQTCCRTFVLCGCGCGNEGVIAWEAARCIEARHGDALRDIALVLEGHGPAAETGRGRLHLAPAPPVVLYVDKEDITAGGIVAAANAALRGLAVGGLVS